MAVYSSAKLVLLGGEGLAVIFGETYASSQLDAGQSCSCPWPKANLGFTFTFNGMLVLSSISAMTHLPELLQELGK